MTIDALNVSEEVLYHCLAVHEIREAWRIYSQVFGNYRHLGLKLRAFERGERICRQFTLDGSPDSPLSEGLTLSEQSVLFNEWAIYLQAIGRLGDATKCYRRGLEIDEERQRLEKILLASLNLAEVSILSGNLAATLQAAQEAVDLMPKLETDPDYYSQAYSCRAYAQALRGNIEEANQDFRSALVIQLKAKGKTKSSLHGIGGRYYAALLTRFGDLGEAESLAKSNIYYLDSTKENSEDEVYACKLILAEIFSIRGELKSARDLHRAVHEWAMDYGALETLCYAKLLGARIAFSKAKGLKDAEAGELLRESLASIEEGLQIAQNCEYSIFFCDLLLIQARILIALGDGETATLSAQIALSGPRESKEERISLPFLHARGSRLLPAEHPDCCYVWGQADAHRTLAEASLLKVAQKSHRNLNTFQELRGEGSKYFERAREHLIECLELQRRLNDRRLSETEQLLAEVDAGRLPEIFLWPAIKATVMRFLGRVQARTSTVHSTIYITKISGILENYVPIPVLMTIEAPSEDDLKIPISNAPESSDREKAAILIYRKPPNEVMKYRIGMARFDDRLVLMPISLAAIEQDLDEPRACSDLLRDYTNRYIPIVDFFGDRTPISDKLAFFGRQPLLTRLVHCLANYQNVGVFGLRKSGKTSIIFQLRFLIHEHPTVYLSFQSLGDQESISRFIFGRVTDHLISLLRIRGYSPSPIENLRGQATAEGPASSFVLQVARLADELEACGYSMPIICLFDEMEVILPRPGDQRGKVREFNVTFAAFRELSQEHRKVSILVADRHPDCNRINNWPGADLPANPLFQFFSEEFLEPFEYESTVEMIKEIGLLMGVKFAKATLLEIHEESGGHPYVARQLASLIWQKSKSGHQGLVNVKPGVATRSLRDALFDSGNLMSYLEGSIWEELSQRNAKVEMDILRVLASSADSREEVNPSMLERKLSYLSTRHMTDALRSLRESGLLCFREMRGGENRVLPRMHLLSRWILMDMSEDEISRWRI